MYDTTTPVSNTKWMCIRTVGVFIEIMGILIILMTGSLQPNDDLLYLMGYIVGSVGWILILLTYSSFMIKKVPAYELFSGYGSRIIIKTTPEQDKIAVCAAKEELENIIKNKRTKSETRRKEMHTMVECHDR
jgi:hypothetical protein